jgi:prepilin peptidase CpaA
VDVPSAILAVAVTATAAVTDLRTSRIPNALTYPAIALGLALGLWPGAEPGTGARAVGMLLGFLPAWAFFLVRGIGGGDVKLLAAVGALVGAPAIVAVWVHGAVFGAVLALGVLVAGGRVRTTLRELGALVVSTRVRGAPLIAPAPGAQMPFAPAILLGLLWTLFAPAFGVPWLLPGLAP